MRRLWLLAFVVLFPNWLGATTVDSLQQELSKAISDSVRLRIINELTHHTADQNPHLSIEYAHQTIHLAEKLGNITIKRQGIHVLGLNHYRLGNYDKTLEYFRQVLRMFEEENDLKGIALLHNNIGIIYDELNQFEKALSYYHKALEVKRMLADSSDVASTLSNIGFAYQKMALPEKAYSYLMQALRIDQSIGNSNGLIYTYQNLGRLYDGLDKADSALFFYHKSLKLLEQTGSQYEHAAVLQCIGNVYLKQKLTARARTAFEQAITQAEKVKAKKVVKDCLKGIAESYKQEKNWMLAYEYFKRYEDLKDSIFSEENFRKISDIESNYQIQRREKEIELLRKDARIQELNLSRNEMVSYYLYSGLFLFFLMILFLYQQYKTKNNSNTLLKKRNNEIASRNAEITDSIRYAKTIQEALLPQEKALKQVFPESFLYCEARDILNGDFFWIHEQDEFVVWAVIDCTGHGVPGALMTILAHNMLSQIVTSQKKLEPSEILKELHCSLRRNMQKGLEADLPHGMDLGVCLYGRKSGKLLYAGARRPIYIMEDDELKIYQTSNPTVGNNYAQAADFRQLNLHPKPGSCVYMFTDGITDQFGGPQNKKFLHNRLQELIRSMKGKSMESQMEILSKGILEWRQQEEQTDDNLMLGIRLPAVIQ
ncbi:tetratricopeptide repeat protein [Cesiribacter sp. SM1]|uniref:tetratricopeptide repeat protein n=1 Tax=Cesiribacter sp. SM1 TaxID=2861196 RepID=UPI001CD3264C|nr:tetratricopeptide repeat protein [Cesiribacter sp. SM1]